MQLAVGEANAAKLLDLTQQEFRALVDKGHLPRAQQLGPHARWDVATLTKILAGEASDCMEDVTW